MKIKHIKHIIILGLVSMLVSCNVIPYRYRAYSSYNQGNVTNQYQMNNFSITKEEDIFTKVKEDIENNQIDTAYHLLYRLYKMQEKAGQYSCNLLYELGIVSILLNPINYNMMDRCFRKASSLACYDSEKNYYIKALIRLWKKEKNEKTLYVDEKDKIKNLKKRIQQQNQQIQQLQKQISDLEFKLKKINQIHQEIEKNRSLPLNIVPQN